MLVIVLFILLLNIVSILLMYYCLGDLNKKEKLIFIAAGIALMYALTTITYWISTSGIEISKVSEMGKDLITFLFVPINSIIILPLLAKSYYRYKMGNLSGAVLRNRGILLGIILVILLIIECKYFTSIQEQVVSLIEENESVYYKEETQNIMQDTNSINEIQDTNSIINNIIENTTNDSNILENNTNVVINDITIQD